MAAPTETGTSAIAGPSATDTQDVTMTIPAGATSVVVAFGGFTTSTVSVTSVQGDPTGSPYNIDDVTLFIQRSAAQFAGLYVMHDTNANWPGTGSITVRVVAANAGQLKAAICCLTDVDTAGTPENDSQTATGASSAPSDVLTSSSNALNVAVAATYSADVGGGDDTLIQEQQNGAGSSSLYFWSESGTGASDTIEGNASVDWAMCSISFEGTGGGGGGATPKGPFGLPFHGPFRGPI